MASYPGVQPGASTVTSPCFFMHVITGILDDILGAVHQAGTKWKVRDVVCSASSCPNPQREYYTIDVPLDSVTSYGVYCH